MKIIKLTFVLFVYSISLSAQVDTIALASSEEYTIELIESITKNIRYTNINSGDSGTLLREQLDEEGKVKPSTSISRIIDVKINDSDIGVLYLKRNVVVYALYKIQEQSKLVNLSMVATIPTESLDRYSLLNAYTLNVENFDNQIESKIAKFDTNGQFQLFLPRGSYEPNDFFINLMKLSDDEK